MYFSNRSVYEDQISTARKFFVGLYDVDRKTGWLLDGASALLHLSVKSLTCEPWQSSIHVKLDEHRKIEKFNYSDPNGGPDAAKTVLMNPENRRMLLIEEPKVGPEETLKVRFEDLVSKNYDLLEQIHDKQNARSTMLELRSPATSFIGFDFLEMAEGERYIAPRGVALQSNGRAWIGLIRKLRAIRLLGNGLGDLIQPTASSPALCEYWKQVPKNQEHLTVCVSTVAEICRKRHLDSSESIELAEGIHWYQPHLLFENRNCGRSYCTQACDRLQVLSERRKGWSSRQRRRPEPSKHRDGALIFGKLTHVRNSPFETHPDEGNQTMMDDVVDDSGLGSSISDSLSPQSGPSRSDTAVQSPSRILQASTATDRRSSGLSSRYADSLSSQTRPLRSDTISQRPGSALQVPASTQRRSDGQAAMDRCMRMGVEEDTSIATSLLDFPSAGSVFPPGRLDPPNPSAVMISGELDEHRQRMQPLSNVPRASRIVSAQSSSTAPERPLRRKKKFTDAKKALPNTYSPLVIRRRICFASSLTSFVISPAPLTSFTSPTPLPA